MKNPRSRLYWMILVVFLLAACQQTSVPEVTPEMNEEEFANDENTTIDAAALQAWSNPASWPGGKVPVAGEAVFIPKGKSILLDISPPAFKSLQIDGSLIFDRKDLNLSAGYIVVHGLLQIGTSQQRFANKATITLTATNPAENIMDMGTRGILVMGGRLELFGSAPSIPWTKLNANAARGATALTLRNSVPWQANDQVVIAPTDFFPHQNGQVNLTAVATEKIGVAAVSGTTLTLKSGLRKSRWGQLQYVSNSGMTTTPTTAVTPLVLDERAAVGNLTRNIVIQGADDALWRNQGFGGHIMVMGTGARAVLMGAELRRMGQLGLNGRYPIHFHLLSYDRNGNALADASSSLVANSSISDSQNRCVVIHGTNGLRVKNNICYNIKGHAIFLEDAVERRNTLTNNLVLMVRNPPKDKLLLEHEGSDIPVGGSSGFWLSNPDNTVRGNLVADAQNIGFWLAFPEKTLGLNQNVDLLPMHMPFGVFADNTAHSNLEGIHIDNGPTRADPGLLESIKYIPMIGGKPLPNDFYNPNHWLRFKLERVTIFKNGNAWGLGPFWNRVSWPDYVNWVSADNTSAFFAGAGDNGRITQSLIVGTSLNNTPSPDTTTPIVALASYHSTFDMDNNVIVNFPFVPKYPGSGAFKTDDYYTIAVDKGLVRNPNNRLINSHPGYRVPPPNMRSDTDPNGRDNWTLAGALWNPHGYWGAKGNYWVYDVPFLTSGANCSQVEPAGQNGVSCDGEYYGVINYVTDFDGEDENGDPDYLFMAPINVSRRNPGNVNQEIGKWTVADGNISNFFGNMRHFAARPGGYYVLNFPGNALPKRFETSIQNAYRSTDWFMLGVSFDRSITPSQVSLTSNTNTTRTMSATTSLQNVLNSRGDKYWRDTAQNLIWVKIVGGLPSQDAPVNSDTDLYRQMRLVIR